MSELKPCPFCGKIPKPDWTDESYIECTNRKRDIYRFGMSTGSWNTRPIEDALNARIAELEASQRWIPVSERLPESETVVIVYDRRTGKVYEGYLSSEVGDWCENTWWLRRLGDVTHWMPKVLPQPPDAALKGGGE